MCSMTKIVPRRRRRISASFYFYMYAQHISSNMSVANSMTDMKNNKTTKAVIAKKDNAHGMAG